MITASLDDFSPNSVLPNTCGGQYGSSPEIWRRAVIQFVRQMLAAGFITPIYCREGYHLMRSDEICRLLEYGDCINGLDVELIWDVLYFGGTPKLTEFLKENNLGSWEALNGELSQSLGKALSDMGIVG